MHCAGRLRLEQQCRVRQSLLGLGLLAFDAAAAFASEDIERSQPLLSTHVGAQSLTCEEAST